jgi:glycerol-3-phosphate acyltransferase PlsY
MNKSLTITALVAAPASVLASGSEALSLLWLSLLVFIVVVVSLYLAKITSKQKLFVFLVYLAAVIAGYVTTSGMPYLKNMYLINTINTALPFIAWLVVYVYSIKKHNKSLNQIGAKDAPPG